MLRLDGTLSIAYEIRRFHEDELRVSEGQNILRERIAVAAGGELLRGMRLRKREGQKAKLTIEEVAEQAAITDRALSDIERGVTARPKKEVLERILDALDSFVPLTVEERNDVLVAFGYPPLLVPPSETERKRIALEWQVQFRHLTLPAYLVDFTQRLLAWNRFAPCILGLQYGDQILDKFEGITIFDLALNPSFIAASRIANGAEFLPQMVRVIKAELEPFRSTSWCQELIRRTSDQYPLFREIWDSLPSSLPMVRLRTMGPIRVRHQNGSLLQFHLMGVDFINDPRFRVVQYHPVDANTLNEWNSWIEKND